MVRSCLPGRKSATGSNASRHVRHRSPAARVPGRPRIHCEDRDRLSPHDRQARISAFGRRDAAAGCRGRTEPRGIHEEEHGRLCYWIVMPPSVNVCVGSVVVPTTRVSPDVVIVTVNGTPVRTWPQLQVSTVLVPLKVTLPSMFAVPLSMLPSSVMF